VKYPKKFTDKVAVTEAYDKIMGEYKETGDETRREDFKENFLHLHLGLKKHIA
jgi:hypothetical protein